jgi:uncharacterized protein YjbI with pentapeptide repeats
MPDLTGPPGGRGIPKGAVKSRAPQQSQIGNLSGLQGAVNDASSRAAALWLSFLTFMAYLTMTVGAVTHEALLKQKPIKLPVLNVDLPLVSFFWIAPLFFLLFHFYLFLQLVILVRKVASFDANLRAAVATEQEREEYRKRLDSFLVVQFLCGAQEERTGVTGRLLRSIAVITLVILPILLLLQFQLTFLPYHDAWVTWVHRIAILTDIRIAWVFWFAISKGGGEIDFPEFDFKWWKGFAGGTIRQKLRSAVAEPFAALKGVLNNRRRFFISGAAVVFSSFFVFAFGDEPIARVFQVPVLRISNDALTWEFEPISDVVLHGPINMVEGRPSAWFSNVLVVPNKKLIDDDAVETDFPSFSLRGRNLSGAVLPRSDLRNVDFTGANLNDAVLDLARLEHARFGCAGPYDRRTKPGWPEDGCTWLQRASLTQARLQAAYFMRARMHGAILIGANLQGADLTAAQLQGVMLSKARLEAASLAGANLKAAFLDEAVLIGVNFSNTQLQQVLLGDTRLELASIQYMNSASLDGTPLRIARPLAGEDREKLDDQISRSFRYSNISPGVPGLDFENVSADFDLKSLTRFRQSATASLIPSGIIDRDFETTYDNAIEKKWNEVADIVKDAKHKDNYEGLIKDYMIGFLCDVGSAAFITPAFIRSEHIMMAGQQAIEVIHALKNASDNCPGAQSLKPDLRLILGAMELRAAGLTTNN